MHKILLAGNAGFCYGVKRAMAIAEEVSKESETSYTYGPLIHNPQAVSYLRSIGVYPINNLDEVSPGKLIVRSHGLPPKIINAAKKKGFTIVDATCPFVRRPQNFAKMLLEKNYKVVVIGEAKHPEVVGIVGHAKGKATVIEKESDIEKLKGEKKIGIVTQTTQSMEYFRFLVSKILEIATEIKIYNTICGATQKRQKSTLALSKRVDLMIIIGGKDSANTTHLAQLSRNAGKPTHHIESSEEFQSSWLRNTKLIGVSAGASTPAYVIDEVIEKLKSVTKNASGPDGPRLSYREELLND